MSKIKDGGPAFPHAIIYANSDSPFEILQGLSLRDYFAAKAMQGLLAADPDTRWDDYDCAKYAYAQADAMLAERECGEST